MRGEVRAHGRLLADRAPRCRGPIGRGRGTMAAVGRLLRRGGLPRGAGVALALVLTLPPGSAVASVFDQAPRRVQVSLPDLEASIDLAGPLALRLEDLREVPGPGTLRLAADDRAVGRLEDGRLLELPTPVVEPVAELLVRVARSEGVWLMWEGAPGDGPELDVELRGLWCSQTDGSALACEAELVLDEATILASSTGVHGQAISALLADLAEQVRPHLSARWSELRHLVDEDEPPPTGADLTLVRLAREHGGGVATYVGEHDGLACLLVSDGPEAPATVRRVPLGAVLEVTNVRVFDALPGDRWVFDPARRRAFRLVEGAPGQLGVRTRWGRGGLGDEAGRSFGFVPPPRIDCDGEGVLSPVQPGSGWRGPDTLWLVDRDEVEVRGPVLDHAEDVFVVRESRIRRRLPTLELVQLLDDPVLEGRYRRWRTLEERWASMGRSMFGVGLPLTILGGLSVGGGLIAPIDACYEATGPCVPFFAPWLFPVGGLLLGAGIPLLVDGARRWKQADRIDRVRRLEPLGPRRRLGEAIDAHNRRNAHDPH